MAPSTGVRRREAVLINTHYMAEQVVDFLENWHSKEMQIVTTYESKLLGTAGTLLANSSFFEGSTGLLIHADNAMDGDLSGLLFAHENRPNQCLLTMLTFQTDRPKSCGIIVTDSDGVVIQFHEKVDTPPGNCANGALYVFDTPFLDYLSSLSPPPSDFSTEVIPTLLGRIHRGKLISLISTSAHLLPSLKPKHYFLLIHDSHSN